MPPESQPFQSSESRARGSLLQPTICLQGTGFLQDVCYPQWREAHHSNRSCLKDRTSPSSADERTFHTEAPCLVSCTLHSPCLLLRCALVSFLLHKADRASAWSYTEVMSLSLWHQSVAMVTYRAVQNSVLWHHCRIRQQNKPTPQRWLMQHKQLQHFNPNVKVELHFVMIFFINTVRSLSSRKTIQKVIKLKTSRQATMRH